MAGYKDAMNLVRDYHRKMDQEGVDILITPGSMIPAPVKVFP